MAITLSGDSGITTPMYNGTVSANQVTPSVNMKNRLINGNMVVNQRATSITATGYSVDRWKYTGSQASKGTVAQNTTAPTGFTNSLGFTSSSAYSVGASDFFFLAQCIEGYNIADLAWGTVNAKTVTLSFQVYSSLTGTFGGVLTNGANNRTYPFTYTISSANTWTSISITVAGDTTGTWATDNTSGLFVLFGLGSGSTYSGAAGSWSGNTYFGANSTVSVVGTNGATFYITGVQLEVGSSATSFDYRPYGTELALCQRYLPAFNYNGGGDRYAGAATSTTNSAVRFIFPVTPRTSPTGISVSSVSHWSIFNNANGAGGTATALSFTVAGFSVGELAAGTTAGSPTITAGNPVVLYPNNASAQILFTGCEL